MYANFGGAVIDDNDLPHSLVARSQYRMKARLYFLESRINRDDDIDRTYVSFSSCGWLYVAHRQNLNLPGEYVKAHTATHRTDSHSTQPGN